jgi:hypothetical protein
MAVCLQQIFVQFIFAYVSTRFTIKNWNLLDTLSVLPLLKPLRLTVYNLETLFEDKDCQLIVKLLPMLNAY